MKIRRPDYMIDETKPGRERNVARFYKRWFWHAAAKGQATGSVELLMGHRKNGHGWGIVFGRNGGESDIGLDIFCGRLLSLWMRLRSERTARFRDANSYSAWHYGVRIRQHSLSWVEVLWHHDPMGSSRAPGRWTINKHTFLGKSRADKETLDFGTCQIPLPEGIYPATWTHDRYISRYVGWLGILRDRIFDPKTTDGSFWIDIPGGIPVEGKGENSWDCGMDGLFGTGGRTLDDAIGNVVAAVTRDRNRYGGPHDLPHPMGVAGAEGLN